MTERSPTHGKEDTLSAQANRSSETLAQLRAEVEQLRAARERLVLAVDDDHRALERELHEGVQQHLVALAVNLQLATPVVDSDPAAARALLESLGRDVEQALHESARLAQRIYAPQLETGGLALALRAAAAGADIGASVEVAADASYPGEVLRTVFLCWLAALESAERATIAVRDEDGALAFELGAYGVHADARFERLRDRVEALGGRLTIEPEPGSGFRLSGALPHAR